MAVIRPNLQGIGAAIRQARRSRGWTQQQLATQAGVSRAFVTGVERGQRPGAELARVLSLLAALSQTIEIAPDTQTTLAEALAQATGGRP